MSTGGVFGAEATSYLGRDGGFLVIISGVQIFLTPRAGGVGESGLFRHRGWWQFGLALPGS